MIQNLVESVQSFFGARKIRTKPKIIPKEEHGIDRSKVSPFAISVCEKLQAAGYSAYIVGGAVRDLLIGHRPKDFDVATDATPEEVRKVTKRAIIIGRRFKLVHVIKGSEIIEVSTFRALSDQGVEKSESGRVTDDNVFGEQWEDAARRDFTANAIYYDPTTEEVLDYHNGMEDIKNKCLRMIGDPAERYREDPVRIMRAVRIASKLGFTIDEKTAAPMKDMAPLLIDVPLARLNDELLKILSSGASLKCLQNLKEYGIQLPIPILTAWQQNPDNLFLRKALGRCDQRVEAGRSISPSFLYAALLWPQVTATFEQSAADRKASKPKRWGGSCEEVIEGPDSRGIQKRFFKDIREIWSNQPKFEKRIPSVAFRLIDHPRFRASYDFLLIRASCGEVPHEVADWWTAFEAATEEERKEMLQEVSRRPGVKKEEGTGRKKKRSRSSRRKKTSLTSPAPGTTSEELLPYDAPEMLPEPVKNEAPAPVEKTASSEPREQKPRSVERKRRYPGALLSKTHRRAPAEPKEE